MTDAVEICARLLREGTVARREIADMDIPEVRSDVERRLRDVGLVLATSAYSDEVGIRLAPEIVSHSAFDSASNLGLRSDACALLAILWFRLVLRRRTVVEERNAPGQASLIPEERAIAAINFIPEVRFETIYREFGAILGSRTNLRRLVAQLRNLRFVEVRAGRFLRPGPLLELGIDGEAMMAFVRTRALGGILNHGQEASPPDTSSDPEEQLLKVLQEKGGEVRMAKLVEITAQSAIRLRQLLRNLIDEGSVEKIGERGETHYRCLKTGP